MKIERFIGHEKCPSILILKAFCALFTITGAVFCERISLENQHRDPSEEQTHQAHPHRSGAALHEHHRTINGQTWLTALRASSWNFMYISVLIFYLLGILFLTKIKKS